MPIIPVKVELGAFAEGEVPPDLLITFRDFNKVVVNLSGFSSLQMNIEEELAGSGFGTGTMVATDLPNGLVTYQWVKADMQALGEYTAQAWVDNGTKFFASDLYIYSVYDGPGTPP